MSEFGKKSVPVAFFTYPVMQVANILLPRAHLVPVGEDQLPHIELTREVARRFNRDFKDVFPEPEGLVGRVPRLAGIDGQAKMSKSLNNAIYLKDDAATVADKIRRMFGGPPRGADEPGNPDDNPIMLYLRAFDPDADEVAGMEEQYRTRGVGNKVLKDRLTVALNDMLDPFRDRRARYASNMRLVRDALAAGTEAHRSIARETMALVRDALDLGYLEKY
jgi:tryptophanyl-tRNA synthetase